MGFGARIFDRTTIYRPTDQQHGSLCQVGLTVVSLSESVNFNATILPHISRGPSFSRYLHSCHCKLQVHQHFLIHHADKYEPAQFVRPRTSFLLCKKLFSTNHHHRKKTYLKAANVEFFDAPNKNTERGLPGLLCMKTHFYQYSLFVYKSKSSASSLIARKKSLR